MNSKQTLLTAFVLITISLSACIGLTKKITIQNRAKVGFDKETSWYVMEGENIDNQRVYKLSDGLLVFLSPTGKNYDLLLTLIPESAADNEVLYRICTEKGVNFKYSKNILSIEKDSMKIHFIVDNEEGNKEMRKYNHSRIIKGIQLGLCRNKFDLSKLRIEKNYGSIKEFFEGKDKKAKPNCTSGGEGANGCSTHYNIVGVSSGCSVSCKSGYYACCNSNSNCCSCIKEKRDQ